LSDTEIADLYAAQSTFPGTPDNLVADYSLNGNGTDDTQFGNHAELGDGAAATSNRHGWGSNALVGAAKADNSIALQSDYTTISFWVKPNSFPAAARYTCSPTAAGRSAGKSRCPRTANRYLPPIPAALVAAIWTPVRRSAVGAWTHVVMVHDGTKDIIYFNGAQVAEKNVAGAFDKTRHPLGIGYDPIDNGGFFRRRHRRRADLQRSPRRFCCGRLVQCPKPGEPVVGGPLVAHYAFSGNSRDETAYNNHASNAGLGKDRFGKANKAAAFNGTSRK
jgi:hypothetical protein